MQHPFHFSQYSAFRSQQFHIIKIGTNLSFNVQTNHLLFHFNTNYNIKKVNESVNHIEVNQYLSSLS